MTQKASPRGGIPAGARGRTFGYTHARVSAGSERGFAAGLGRPIRARYGILAVALSLLFVLNVILVVRRGEPAPADAVAAPDAAQGSGVVDSIFPVEEEIRRFRVGLPEVTALSRGANTRDELVDRFVRAVERADTAALADLLLTRAEFAYLYYPHTMYTARPYELSPALVWFQMQNLTSSGLTRVLQRTAKGPLLVRGYRCEETPKTEGPNRVWNECKVTLQTPGAESTEMQLFGSVLERGGVLKFVSYASDL
jgi:hypothetical protein